MDVCAHSEMRKSINGGFRGKSINTSPPSLVVHSGSGTRTVNMSHRQNNSFVIRFLENLDYDRDKCPNMYWVNDFVRKFWDILPEKHLRILKAFKTKNSRYGKLRWNGKHYSDCCWYHPSCKEGPDTCACVFFDNLRDRVMAIMERYKYEYI